MKWLRILAPFLFALVLTGCAGEEYTAGNACHVVLEEGEGFFCADHTQVITRGADAAFYVEPEDGYEIIGADYEDCSISNSRENGVVVKVRNVRYSTVVTLIVRKSDAVFICHPNDGIRQEPVSVPVTPSHLRWNTPTGLFTREGHSLTGWNTKPDGTGIAVGLGSRIDPRVGTELYAQWSPWTDSNLFRWELCDTGIAITGYTGTDPVLSVPASIDGMPVTEIRADAFRDRVFETVVLPDSLYTLEEGAFRNGEIARLYLYDNVRRVGDPGAVIRTLHINALELPVYSGTYYDTFQDKYDRLLSLRDTRKIVLFSGSSTRFGYDSEALAQAFPDYAIVNMGVFAYTNARTQMELILPCMQPGDILIHMPEFDTSDTQFCISSDLDEAFFNMMESNYDAIAGLDLRTYTNVFPMLQSYLSTRETMVKKSYAISTSDYDEDGNPVDSPSYNVYGDYIVYRPNPASSFPVFGMPVPYTVAAFPEEPFINSINRMYQRFLDAGVTVYFTYAPRNAMALSEASTPQARAELDAWFREKLCVPVISEIEDSLWSGIYLYGTDNHLSTEGVALHMERLIPLIKAQMARDGLEGEHD